MTSRDDSKARALVAGAVVWFFAFAFAAFGLHVASLVRTGLFLAGAVPALVAVGRARRLKGRR